LDSTLFNLIVVGLLVAANGFFVAAEFAIVKVRSGRIDQLAEGGSVRAKAAAHVLDHVDAYLSACQLGITLASLGLGWVGEPFLAGLFEPLLHSVGVHWDGGTHVLSATCAFLLITFLHIVVGEMAPKSLAIRTAEPVALWSAWPLRVFNAVFFPFIWLLNASANLLLRIVGIPPAGEGEEAHTQDELRLILAHSHRHGHLSRRERQLMERVLDLPKKVARQVMRPRTAMVVLRAEQPLAANLKLAAESGHSRFPVCVGEAEDVIGFVLIRDLYAAAARGETDLRRVMRKALFLPENAPLERVLVEFQRRRVHLAVIIDEYGATAGLVTLEDVLEEIVGEIQDEGDAEAPMIRRVTEGVFVVDGLCPLSDFAKRTELDVAEFEGQVDTVAGLVLTLVGAEPRPGQEALWEGHRFRVEAVEGRRITRVRYEAAVAPVSPSRPASPASTASPGASTQSAPAVGTPAAASLAVAPEAGRG
jgi:CBS domain containing-hemolysin-like protein